MKSEISVFLTLTGLDLEPDKITNQLGIVPTKTWKKGDLVDPRAKIRFSENGWSLQSQLEKSAELEDQLKSIFEQLQPTWNTLRKICSYYDTEIECVIYVINQVPAIHFDRETLEKINQLNAEIDVDLYVLPESYSQAEQESLSLENDINEKLFVNETTTR